MRLEQEIKADEKGKWEFELVIGQLEVRVIVLYDTLGAVECEA